MPFWSSQTVKRRLAEKGADILTPFEPALVRQGAVQMRVGEFAAKSKDGEVEISTLNPDIVFTVPPGQFALLLTEEVLHLPNNVIGFITIKTRYKARGLVNVSGFHVDPGFNGRLKFWIYNAGNQSIVFKRLDCAFHIWFSDIDEPVEDPYKNDPGQLVITSEDIAKMQHGEVPTPAAIRTDFEALKVELTENCKTVSARLNWLIGILTTVGVGLLLFFAYKYFAGETSSGRIAPAPARVQSGNVAFSENAPSGSTSTTAQMASSSGSLPPPTAQVANANLTAVTSKSGAEATTTDRPQPASSPTIEKAAGTLHLPP